jgi:3-methylcrotonyl-CoA carboxylase beta subunit
MVEGQSSIFLAGPYLVKAAVGEDIDAETLGGAVTHTEISGIADYKFKTEQECLDHVKRTIGKMGEKPNAGFNRTEAHLPKKNASEILDILPDVRTKPYNMLEIIERLVDNSEFDEFKKDYGKTIICGYARIDGWAVGIVANQRMVVKSAKGEVQIGGVIYNDSAEDVTGFMVGSRSEHSGITKDGAKMVNAVSNSIVPKFTIIVGNSYGAGNYAMCGKAYNPHFIYAWHSAKIAVMGGEQAAKTLLQTQIASMKAKGKELTKEEENEILKEITARYNTQTTPYYAAARLWVDEIIDPADTRTVISKGIEAANHAPIEKDFRTGVFQV